MTTLLDPELSQHNSKPSVKDIPGPPPTRFFGTRGNLIQFLSDQSGYLMRLYRNYGELANITAGHEGGMIFAFGPAYNQHIYSQPQLFQNLGISYPGPKGSSQYKLGFGLLSMNGEQHRKTRNLVNPPFHPKAVAEYQPFVIEVTRNITEKWEQRGFFNIWIEMKKLTRLVTSQVLFGLENPKPVFKTTDLAEQWLILNASPLIRLFPYHFPGSPYWKMLRLAEQIERSIKIIMEDKRARHSPEAKDVLSLLMRKRPGDEIFLSDDETIGLINLIFNASYETTSASLMWIFFILSQHPQILADLVDELNTAGNLSFEQLNQLPLLDRVVTENLRVFSTIIYNYRIASEAFELGGYQFPKGAKVAISPYVTHHMESVFQDPERFWPDRWLQKFPAYSYVPFGAGPHACLGASFSLMILKTVLSVVLPKYRLTVKRGSRLNRTGTLVLRPAGGIWMKATKQDRRFRDSKVEVCGNVHEMVKL